MAAIIDDFGKHWYVYLSMPIIAAVIGYLTKLVAIRMMFNPLEFRGKKPILGWQGIVPRRAGRMASIACETMTRNLISASEVVRRLDPERIAKEIEEPLLDAVDGITRDVAAEFQPGLWESLPERAQRAVIHRIQKQSPEIVRAVLTKIQEDVDSVFDLKEMVVTNLVKDKALLNRMFQEAGRKEFTFIAHSGIYFGFAIGVIQMLAWALLKSAWIMPVFGLFTGWFTDWLALKMIFNPKEPKRYLGLFEWQGLFLKRRKEVSARYGELIAEEVITPHKVLHAVLNGPLSDRLFVLVQREVQRTLDAQTGLAKPLVVMAVGSAKYRALKLTITDEIMRRLPATLAHIEGYATEAMDIRNLLVTKMQQLSSEEFEGLLRPAFQQDEWILITVGAVLGFMVGELQVLLVEHLAR
ncbi:MAG: DUF445 domain-containing protein [Sciscionella sp.]